MLRTLLHSPTWRPVVVPALDSRLDALCDAAAAVGGAPPVSVMVDGVAALAVLGGLPESLRPGGVAWLDSLDAHQGLTGVIAAYSPSAPKAQIALHGDAAGACAWFVCAAAFPRVQPPKPDPSPGCAVPCRAHVSRRRIAARREQQRPAPGTDAERGPVAGAALHLAPRAARGPSRGAHARHALQHSPGSCQRAAVRGAGAGGCPRGGGAWLAVRGALDVWPPRFNLRNASPLCVCVCVCVCSGCVRGVAASRSFMAVAAAGALRAAVVTPQKLADGAPPVPLHEWLDEDGTVGGMSPLEARRLLLQFAVQATPSTGALWHHST